jgi:hypothetical protein
LNADDVFLGARRSAALARAATSRWRRRCRFRPAPRRAPTTSWRSRLADAAPEGDEWNNTRVANVRIGPDLAVTA